MPSLSLLMRAAAVVVVASCLACNSKPDPNGMPCATNKDCGAGYVCYMPSPGTSGHCLQVGTVDFSTPLATKPTCVPPGTVTCGAGEKFYSSPTESGCYPTGDKPPGANPDPGYDTASGPCPKADNVISCDTPPTCSFCLSIAAAIPVGCYKM